MSKGKLRKVSDVRLSLRAASRASGDWSKSVVPRPFKTSDNSIPKAYDIKVHYTRSSQEPNNPHIILQTHQPTHGKSGAFVVSTHASQWSLHIVPGAPNSSLRAHVAWIQAYVLKVLQSCGAFVQPYYIVIKKFPGKVEDGIRKGNWEWKRWAFLPERKFRMFSRRRRWWIRWLGGGRGVWVGGLEPLSWWWGGRRN